MQNEGSIARVHVVASGLVQGVFFRDSVRREAMRLGVSGWVRNRADGRVEAEFQGSPALLDQMVEYCRRGPGRAEIEELEVAPIAPVPREAGFTIQ